MREKRLEEAKTKNKTFQLFDKMLGIEKNPKLMKIRNENPLNNISVPTGEVGDLDSRIDQYYVPVDLSGETVHPLLHATS